MLNYLVESQHRHREAAAADVSVFGARGPAAEARTVNRAGAKAWTGPRAVATVGVRIGIRARLGTGVVGAASSVSACIHAVSSGIQLAQRFL